MREVTVDIEERCGKGRICIRWHGYDRELVTKVRTVPGRGYVKSYGKHWHAPLDMETCRTLRKVFGDRLVIGESLNQWARAALREERKLGSIASKDTATLKRLPSILPQLYDAIHLGPLGRHMTEPERIEARLKPASYQAGDVEFLSEAPAPLNANEQGLGKTIEWIAAVWESGLEEGDHLVICPKAAADATWAVELEKWQEEVLEQVGVFMCVQDKKEERQEVIDRWLASDLPVRWVVVNPHMLMMRKQREDRRTSPLTLAVSGLKAEERACFCGAKKGAHEHYERPFPELFATQWRTLVIDEAHRGVVRNHKSLTFKSLKALELTDDGKPCLMTGTPMKKLGGADIWGMLNFLRPEQFSSYWRLVDQYFEVTDNGFGKKVGLLREDRQEAFFRTLTPFVLRRTKKEAAPWLPEKLYVDVDVHMSKRQAKQYRQMHNDAMTRLGKEEVSAGGVLAQITRLKQFANAHCKIDADGTIIPIASPKVDAMIGKMEEVGMFDPGSDRKQLVFSQSKRMVNFIAERLRKEGLIVETITGETKDRRALVKRFQEGDIRVMVIVTTAGGVSLTLDAAEEVHLIDEMWSPDDDEQAEDRAHRVSRIHQVTVFIYRTLDTVDEDIAVSKAEKKDSHQLILDIRRSLSASHT